MMIQIDPASPVPPYEQVRSQVATLARDGQLPAGTRLPTVRHLAAELNLAVNTVARAYRELEAASLVETRGRHGTFVTHRAGGVPAEAEHLVDRHGGGPKHHLDIEDGPVEGTLIPSGQPMG